MQQCIVSCSYTLARSHTHTLMYTQMHSHTYTWFHARTLTRLDYTHAQKHTLNSSILTNSLPASATLTLLYVRTYTWIYTHMHTNLRRHTLPLIPPPPTHTHAHLRTHTGRILTMLLSLMRAIPSSESLHSLPLDQRIRLLQLSKGLTPRKEREVGLCVCLEKRTPFRAQTVSFTQQY